VRSPMLHLCVTTPQNTLGGRLEDVLNACASVVWETLRLPAALIAEELVSVSIRLSSRGVPSTAGGLIIQDNPVNTEPFLTALVL